MKILVIRFSSIGDIILCSPVLRLLKKNGHEVHFLSKKSFSFALEFQPNIDRLWLMDHNLPALLRRMHEEKFDLILDLHNNLRSRRCSLTLNVPVLRFQKLNLQKWIYTRTKINLLPRKHIVDRYTDPLRKMNIFPDAEGLEYYCGEQAETEAKALLKAAGLANQPFVAVVAGGQHFTKIFPAEKLKQVLEKINVRAVILGGKADQARGEFLEKMLPDQVLNLCGKTDFNVSAAILSHATCVLCNDTGLMHVAAAFHKPIVSVWGNTVPEFGMYPFYGREIPDHYEAEVFGLSCRPCSKIGYDACPKGHFKCMELQNTNAIAQRLELMLNIKP